MGDLSDFNVLDLTVKCPVPDHLAPTTVGCEDALSAALPAQFVLSPTNGGALSGGVNGGVNGGGMAGGLGSARNWFNVGGGFTNGNRRLNVEPISPCSPPPMSLHSQQQTRYVADDEERFFQFQQQQQQQREQQSLYSGRDERENSDDARRMSGDDHSWRPQPQSATVASTLRSQLMRSRSSSPEADRVELERRREPETTAPLPPMKRRRILYEAMEQMERARAAQQQQLEQQRQYSPPHVAPLSANHDADDESSTVETSDPINSSPLRRLPFDAAVDASTVPSNRAATIPSCSPHVVATPPRSGAIDPSSIHAIVDQPPHLQQQNETSATSSGMASRMKTSAPAASSSARFNEYYLNTLLKVGRGSELSPSMLSYLRDLASVDSTPKAGQAGKQLHSGRNSVPTSASSSPVSTTNDSDDHDLSIGDEHSHPSSSAAVPYQTSTNSNGAVYHQQQQYSPVLGGALSVAGLGPAAFPRMIGNLQQQQLQQQQQRIHDFITSTSPPPLGSLLMAGSLSRPARQRQSSSGVSTPVDRDEAYRERRRKNNEAAKRSRDTRRQKEMQVAQHAALLEQENIQLKAELAVLRSHAACLQRMVLDRVTSYAGNNNNSGGGGVANGNNAVPSNGNHSENYYVDDDDSNDDVTAQT